jgi:hypothetical protein
MWFTHSSLISSITLVSLLHLAECFPSALRDDLDSSRGFGESSVTQRGDRSSPLHNLTSSFERRQSPSPEWLRIMPLGASIVQGTRSTPADGFRKPLRDHLRSKGYKVNMVGSV